MKRAAFALVLLAGCTVADEPYPAAWGPLPPAAAGCRNFHGTYADRGEALGQAARPSLTRELFGADSPWEKAVSLELDPREETLEIRVAAPGAREFSRRLTTKAREFSCEHGRLIVRSRRWVTSDVMSGRESVRIELHQAEQHLVAHVDETTTGVMFMVVPLSGESARWYRFERLKP